jgi:serine/threonine-protein kinase
VWLKRADGTGEPERLLDASVTIDEAFYSEGDEWIIYRRGKSLGERDIFAIRPNVDDAAIPVVTSSFDEVAPALSPNGRWLAYVSNRADKANVYVRPFPEANTEILVSINGGSEPKWARNRPELYYRNGAGEMVAVLVSTGDEFTFGEELILFPATAYRSDFFHAAYDVTADGERFVMSRLTDSETTDEELIVVENWFEELKELVPTK